LLVFLFLRPDSARDVHIIPPLLISAKILSLTKECAMPVLTPKLEEQIRIGDDIIISILRVKGNTVRIGIEAPREIRVVRGELPRHDKIDTRSSFNATRDVVVPENLQTEEGTIPGDEESMKPATTAVRQFLAQQARRRPRGPKFPRAVETDVATAMARSL